MISLSSAVRRQTIAEESCTAPRLVSRLMGLETEYAVLVHGDLDAFDAPRPSARSVFSRLLAAMQLRQPSAVGLIDNDQHFFANGAAISFESHPSMRDAPGGLFEMSTPEVRLPSDLVASQRAIDRMMENAADHESSNNDFRVLKNNRDSIGHLYGCQENYEADVASGLWLVVYRACVILLWMLQIATAIITVPMIVLVIGSAVVRSWWNGSLPDETQDAENMFQRVPSWLARTLVSVVHITHRPLAAAVRLIGARVAFRHQRKHLTALLVSRPVICGSGDLDEKGRYSLSAKAVGIDRIADIGGYQGERPIYVYGHWFGQLCVRSWDSLWQTHRLLRRRQRLQIGLSDSNMSELAEFVKVGSVSLVLDMIESGQTAKLPLVKKPLESMRHLCGDWNLVARVATQDGDKTALEIQLAYWQAAEQFVRDTSATVRGEAEKVLTAWKDMLDASAAFRRDADDVSLAIGRVDWLTKRWLMDRQCKSVSQSTDPGLWMQRKKIDLRYHELSRDGYFRQITLDTEDLTLIPASQRKARKIAPPSNSPAARRAWTIREFSCSMSELRVSWTHATVNDGRRKRWIDFGNRVY